MTRSHRAFHRRCGRSWLLAVALGFGLALALRPPPDDPPAAAVTAAMSVGFRAVQWNRDKLVYDGVLVAAVALYIVVFLVVGAWLDPPQDELAEIDLRIRALRQLRPS